MTFITQFEMVGDIAEITLTGKLDTAASGQFKLEMEKAFQLKAKHLVLLVKNLEYLASSGLRILVFFKQKMGPSTDIIVVAPTPLVKEILEITGFHYAVKILTEYDRSLFINQEKSDE